MPPVLRQQESAPGAQLKLINIQSQCFEGEVQHIDIRHILWLIEYNKVSKHKNPHPDDACFNRVHILYVCVSAFSVMNYNKSRKKVKLDKSPLICYSDDLYLQNDTRL